MQFYFIWFVRYYVIIVQLLFDHHLIIILLEYNFLIFILTFI
jgi:hypothetical protein